jgi:FkbM family methyltransferase
VLQQVVRKYPDAAVIDIGANIGDSVVILKQIKDAPILAIEGDHRYFSLLQENTRHYQQVTIVNSFVGEPGEHALTTEMNDGTGRLVPADQASDAGAAITLHSLEAILNNYPQYAQAKLLKIDTDGMDVIILESAATWLQAAKPILFFEYYPRLIAPDQRDPLALTQFLRRLGYSQGLVFVNTGELLMRFDLDRDAAVLVDLHHFSLESRRPFFYDLCVAHSSDQGVIQQIHQHTRTAAAG